MLSIYKQTTTDLCQFFIKACSNALLSKNPNEYKPRVKDIIVEIGETLISKKKNIEEISTKKFSFLLL